MFYCLHFIPSLSHSRFQAVAALRSGTRTSVALTEECLSLIQEKNGVINAMVAVDSDALSVAQRSDLRRKGELHSEIIVLSRETNVMEELGPNGLSPLDGIPITLKDNFMCKGLQASCGSRMLKEFVAPYDSTVARRYGGDLLGSRIDGT